MTDSISELTQARRASVEIPQTYSFLFRSNACPSAKAHASIKSLIAAHERQLVSLQEDVTHLKCHLADMERQQARVQEALVQLHATLAPIKRLPPEVLSEIFERCLDGCYSRVFFTIAARHREAPLLLGRVCRAWRTVAQTTPRLWRNVHVNVCDGRYSDGLRKDAMPALQTWLTYSGGVPLNLVVLCKTERLLPGLVDLFETIAAHRHRWQAVHVRLQNSPVIFRLVCRAFSGCTSLSTFDVTDGGQSLTVFGARQSEEVGEVHSAQFDLSLAPLCQLSLSLSGLMIRDVQVPWASLTHLNFMQDARSSTSSIADYVAVLRQCTALKVCSITIDSGIGDEPLGTLTLPHLESLQLQVLREAAHTTQVGDLLGALDAPRLCMLAIDDACPRQEVVLYYSQLKAFLQAHARSLRHFKFAISSKYFTSQDLIALVVETPQLKELEYHPDEESSPKGLLETLTPRMQGDVLECLLPCLERFCVYWDTTETVSLVGDMIEKRYTLAERGIAQLKYLSCKPVRISITYDSMSPHPLVENLAARLEPLSQYGLEVDWEAYKYNLEFLYC